MSKLTTRPQPCGLEHTVEFCDRRAGTAGKLPARYEIDAYFRGEKLAGTRILLYWLTIIACAFGRNA